MADTLSPTHYRDTLFSFKAPTLRIQSSHQYNWDEESVSDISKFPLQLGDRHLPRHLVLQRVEVIPSLVNDLCKSLDNRVSLLDSLPDAIWAFPVERDEEADGGDARAIARLRDEYETTVSCRVASSACLHPSQPHLPQLVSWYPYPATAENLLNDKFVCEDRILRVQDIGDSPRWKALPRTTLTLLNNLVEHTPWLVSGMFFNLEGGGVVRDMASHERFPWKFDSREMDTKLEGSPILVDASSTIWGLPVDPPKPTARRSRRVMEMKEERDAKRSSLGSIETAGWLNDRDLNKEYDPTSEDYLQRAWSTAVRVDASAILFDCGNLLRLGVRHRSSQTLFLSDIIDLTASDNPSHGKVCVAIHYASLLDALDRLPSLQATAEIRMHRLKRKAAADSNEARKRLKVTEDIVDELEKKTYDCLSSHSVIALSFHCDELDSPVPVLLWKADCSLHSSVYAPGEYLHIMLDKRLGAGAVGEAFRARIGLSTASSSSPYCSFVVKLASEKDTVERLEHEHKVYQRLRVARVQGVPMLMGYYTNKNATLAVLLLNDVGTSLAEKMDEGQVLLPREQCTELRRSLRDIHKAGVLHRDIRSWNLMEDNNGRVYITDFDRASLRATQENYSDEKKRLNRFLRGKYVDNELIIGTDDIVNA